MDSSMVVPGSSKVQTDSKLSNFIEAFVEKTPSHVMDLIRLYYIHFTSQIDSMIGTYLCSHPRRNYPILLWLNCHTLFQETDPFPLTKQIPFFSIGLYHFVKMNWKDLHLQNPSKSYYKSHSERFEAQSLLQAPPGPRRTRCSSWKF